MTTTTPSSVAPSTALAAAAGAALLAPRSARVSLPGLVPLLLRAARDPLRALEALREAHGDVVDIAVRGKRYFLLAHPAAIQRVLTEPPSTYSRITGLFPDTARFFGQSVLTTEGDQWRRYRRIAQPAFSKELVRAYCGTIPAAMRSLDARFAAACDDGRALSPFGEMSRASLTIIGKTILGEDAGDDVPLDRMLAAFEAGQRYMARRVRLPRSWPTPAERRIRGVLAELDDVLFGLIAKVRARQHREGEAGSRFLRALMHTRDDETDSQLTDRELRDALLTFFGAGYDTTASVLSWACIHLGRDAALQDAVRAEIDGVAAGRDALDVDDVPRLRLTVHALEEAMRLWPPIWMIARRAVVDDTVCGVPVPAGSVCFSSLYLAQRRSDVWPDPSRFDPRRYLDEDAAARPKGSYLPFGMGGHKCIGAGLAMIEMPLVLAHVIRRYRLSVDDAAPLRGLARFTLVPAPAIALRVTRATRPV